MSATLDDLKTVALAALRDVAADQNAPAAARVQAASALLNATASGTAGDASKPLTDLSLGEIEAELGRLAAPS